MIQREARSHSLRVVVFTESWRGENRNTYVGAVYSFSRDAMNDLPEISVPEVDT